MLRIWGRENSNNVKKVLWCAEELGLPYERIPAGGAYGVVNEASYRALNPNGLVPTIEDDGFVLWESNAIVRYLAARYGEGTLYARDPAERAVGDKWMDWVGSALAPSFFGVFRAMVRTPPAERDMAAVEAGIAACAKQLAIVDAALAVQPYLSGARLGMGDIPLGCLTYGWFGMEIARPDLPNLAAWYARLQERPAYRKAVMIPLT